MRHPACPDRKGYTAGDEDFRPTDIATAMSEIRCRLSKLTDEALKIVMRGSDEKVAPAEDLVFRDAMRPTVERPV